MARRDPACEISYLELVSLPSAPIWARRHTNAVLRAWQLDLDTVQTAELLVSELITNAIQAGNSDSRPSVGTDQVERVALTLRLMPDRVEIEVFDNDPNPPILTHATDDAESGRGLMLVQALSKEWGHRLLPAGGKIVYCILDAPEHQEAQPVYRTPREPQVKEIPCQHQFSQRQH